MKDDLGRESDRAMRSLRVNKLEAARRQLETAITLFFEGGDPVSIHTLTCAAYNVIRDVNNSRGGMPMLAKQRYVQLAGKPDLKAMNEPENFFKHADKDPEAELEFFPLFTECLLVDACETYTRLTGAQSPLFMCFLLWFMCHDQTQFTIPESFRPFADQAKRLFMKEDRRGFYEAVLGMSYPSGP
jgi:hypothetical protein